VCPPLKISGVGAELGPRRSFLEQCGQADARINTVSFPCGVHTATDPGGLSQVQTVLVPARSDM
jgi:hypothetical protein